MVIYLFPQHIHKVVDVPLFNIPYSKMLRWISKCFNWDGEYACKGISGFFFFYIGSRGRTPPPSNYVGCILYMYIIKHPTSMIFYLVCCRPHTFVRSRASLSIDLSLRGIKAQVAHKNADASYLHNSHLNDKLSDM